MGIPEAEEKGREEIFKRRMLENFPKFMSDTKPQSQEAGKMNAKGRKKNYTEAYHFQIIESQR